MPIFDVRLEHTKRRQYPKVVFEPGGTPAGSFNLWRGFAVQPNAGASCRPFLDHLRANVCRGDTENFKWLIGWLAHMVQPPAEEPGVAIVLRGGCGVGKTLVGNYVGALFPAHHVTVAQPSELTGNFNAHLQNALLIQVEEGFWAGDKSAEGALKNLVTSETRMGPGAWPQRAVGIESRCPAFDPPPVAAGAGATPQRVRRFAGVRISRGVRDSAPA